MSSPKPRPVTIRGVTYASAREAAEALGVRRTTIDAARSRGRLDMVGTGHGTGRKKPFSLGGVSFSNQSEASRALGHNRNYVSLVMRSGSETRMRKLVRKVMQYARENGINMEADK